ncbi:MAG: enoyl-CoA hydratase-related protein [Acidimicrobiia bacterium]
MDALVTTRRLGHVLVVEMRREDKRNAVNRELADALDAAFNELEDDTELWAGVLTGTPKAFSAGSDLAAGGDYYTERGGEYAIIRRRRRKPLIAAVEGIAFGGGMEIVLACDLVVAASSARFGLPEVKRGVLPTCAALFRAPNALPLNLAREMVLTGEPIDAVRAYNAGFVNQLTEPGATVDAAIAMAERICSNAPLSVQASLQAMNDYVGAGDGFGWEVTVRAREVISGSQDTAEGIKAFFEKRPPQWTAR